MSRGSYRAVPVETDLGARRPILKSRGKRFEPIRYALGAFRQCLSELHAFTSPILCSHEHMRARHFMAPVFPRRGSPDRRLEPGTDAATWNARESAA